MAQYTTLPTLLGVWALAHASAALAGGTPMPLAAAIPAALEQYSREGDFYLPEFSSTDLGALAVGKPVVITFDAPGVEQADHVDAMRAVGLRVFDSPRLLVWLAMLSGSDGQHGRFTRATLSRTNAGSFVRYQHMDLPWPFKARQWIVVCEKNVELAIASNGRIWEHRWSLHPDGEALLASAYEDGRIAGITREKLEDSVYLPANRGAWILFDLGAGRTLAAAYLDADLGGRFPVALVRLFAKRQLRASLEFLGEASGRRYLEYDEKPMLYDGYGAPISQRDARAAALPAAEDPQVVRASYSEQSPYTR